MGKINKGFTLKFNIAFILFGIIFFQSYFSVFAITNNKVKGGVSHYPLMQGEKIELLLMLDGYSEPIFRVDIIDDKGNIRKLTEGYKEFIKENDTYNLKFEEEYTLNDKKFKVYIKEKDEKNEVEKYELTININVNSGIKYDNSYKLDNQRRGNIKKVYDRNGSIEDENLISEGLSEFIHNNENLIGDNIKIENKEGELYKLHVYHVESDNWIIDNEEYRKEITWTPVKSGTYFLVLWIKDSISNNKYDRWVIMPVKIRGNEENVIIDYILPSHEPMLYNDRLKFYIKSSGSDRLQYRVWVITDKGNYIEITDGYSEFIDSDEVYELDIDRNIDVGNHTLWVQVRTIDDYEGYSSFKGKKFSIHPISSELQESLDSNIIISSNNNKVYKTGEEIIIEGINYLEFLEILKDTEYKYILGVFDVNRDKWIQVNHVYENIIRWVPEEEGVYLLYLYVADKKEIDMSMRTGQKIDQVGIRIEPIIVNNQLNINNSSKKYTIVKSFKDLSDAIAKDYLVYIANDKVEKAYMKSLQVIKQIINDDMTELEKVIALNDYIVRNTEYNTDKDIPEGADSYNIYGVLFDNLAVCEGYAEMMKLFLDLLGIPNRVIKGAVFVNNLILDHIWNVVEINGKEYHLDVTWNDPTPDKRDKVSYEYFLVDDSSLNHHAWDREMYGTLDNKEYSYFSKMRFPVKDGKWIYYINLEDRFRLYKIKSDGSENTKLTNDSVVDFIVDKEWIFFSSGIGGYIYRVNKDGLGAIRINNENSLEIRSKGEWIIYKNRFDDHYYMVKKDGSMKLPYEGEKEN
ncbi:DUF5050 domain-containing protein [Oceanirhabdus sp. W0125-5]|uniref:DUF5050 domain-containing protein n=1 Tax=Oceanirhabdus sp. W0125-5 TaxID=2999116 RepID=UPI0022F2C023|nr:DUF5050 domain-containing protein [Oceanirhabdus sp. W0125-5]WBW97379.1 DUF5050 domain-containing protein [Oceanirhabdus sp. W0125-5]